MKEWHMKSTFLVLRCLAALALAVGLFVATANAQTALGTISGRVVDPNEAVIIGAKVMAKNLATGLTMGTETSADGLYTIANLAAGNYEISVEQQGFRR